MTSTDPPLSLYVHIPWCEKKCPYCDFNSHALRGALPEQAYVESLLADLDQELPDIRGKRLTSVFIGGGTPSLFSPRAVETLISGIRARIPSAPDMEITLEANPGSSDLLKFAAFRAAGVTRLSIGIQSFDDAALAAVGRVHDGDSARRAAAAAVSAGFENFNLDLMYGLPGQDPDTAAADIRQALSFEPPHLSCYQLTIEPGTAFFAQPPELPDEDSAWSMQRRLEETLDRAGYTNYEISAFARERRECRHNLNYWQFGDYLGIGAGAHGKLTRQGRIKRTWKLKNPGRYMDNAASADRIGGERTLDDADVVFEFMLNALRLRAPVTESLFRERTGQSLNDCEHVLAQAITDGLIEHDVGRIVTTDRGRRFLDELLQRFAPQVV